MFGTLPQDPPHEADCARVQAWVRERFRLQPADTVMVAEVACSQPGCPPLETVIAFWTDGGTQRHQLKVFSTVRAVVPADLPPWWMKQALAVPPDASLDCC